MPAVLARATLVAPAVAGAVRVVFGQPLTYVHWANPTRSRPGTVPNCNGPALLVRPKALVTMNWRSSSQQFDDASDTTCRSPGFEPTENAWTSRIGQYLVRTTQPSRFERRRPTSVDTSAQRVPWAPMQ